MSLVLKTLKFLLISILLALMLLVGTLIIVLSTPIGTGWLVSQVRSLAGDSLQVSHSEGAITQGLVLQGLQYELEGGTLVIDELQLQWQPASLMSGAIKVDRLAILGGEWIVSSTPSGNEVGASEEFVWPVVQLPLDLSISQLRILNWRGLPVGDLSLAASLELQSDELQLNQFSIESDAANIGASGQLALTPPYSLSLDSEWNLILADQEFSGSTSFFGNLDGLELDNRMSSPIEVDSSGSLRLEDWHSPRRPTLDDLQFDLQHHIPQYRLTQSGATINFGDVRLATGGSGQAVALEMTGELAVEHPQLSSSGEISLVAQLQQLERLQLNELFYQTDQGQLAVDGSLGWAQAPEWNLRLRSENFQVRPGMTIEGEIESSGQFDQELALTTVIDILIVDIDGFEWQISGGADYRSSALVLNQFRLSSGAQELDLNGRVWPSPAFEFVANADSVTQWLPGWQAAVRGDGQVNGQWINPRGQADLRVDQFQSPYLGLYRLNLSLAPGEGDRHVLDLELLDLVREGQNLLEKLNLQGVAGAESADLEVTAASLYGDLYSQLKLEYRELQAESDAEPALNINLQSLVLDAGRDFPTLSLLQPVDSRLTLDRQEIRGACFGLDIGGELCVDGGRFILDGGPQIQAQLEGSNLPSSFAQPWMPPDLVWEGELSGHASVALVPGQPPLVDAYINGEQGNLKLRQLGEDEEPLTYRNLRLAVTSGEGVWSGLASADLPDNSLMQAQGQYQMESGQFQAQVDVELTHLRWLEGISTHVEQPDGQAELRLQASGTPRNPAFELFADISGFEGMLVDTGVQVRDSRMSLTPDPRGERFYELSGRLNTGQGGANLVGTLALADLNNPSLDLQLQGQQLQLFDRPDLTASINPDVQLVWSDGRGNVQGVIQLPIARLQMPKVNGSSLRRSSDEVIVGQAEQEVVQGRLTGRMRLEIGADVRLSGQGLDTALTGSLDAVYGEDGDLALYGTVTIADGIYRAYGRELEIESGSLTFSGESGNPAISIRAVQRYPEYEVGIQISGTAQRPVTELFSSPVMPQTDILAILVTGRRLDRIGEGEAPSLLDAIDTLGIVGGESLSGRIESAFGLSEFRITDDAEGSSVVAGKYILPRLYVELVQSLFDRTSSLGLEYLVNDNLRVRAQSGDAQSMELIYVIERP